MVRLHRCGFHLLVRLSGVDVWYIFSICLEWLMWILYLLFGIGVSSLTTWFGGFVHLYSFFSRCPCAAKVWQLNTGSVSLFLVHSLSLSLLGLTRSGRSCQLAGCCVSACCSNRCILSQDLQCGACVGSCPPGLSSPSGSPHTPAGYWDTWAIRDKNNTVSLGPRREFSHAFSAKCWNTQHNLCLDFCSDLQSQEVDAGWHFTENHIVYKERRPSFFFFRLWLDPARGYQTFGILSQF